MPDSHKNFAFSNVAVAPSPANSGLSLTVTSGHGARFPTPPFNATVNPALVRPTVANSEIVRVTGVAGDVFTIVRAQETSDGGPSARSIVVGDEISASITVKTLVDAENSGGSDYLISRTVLGSPASTLVLTPTAAYNHLRVIASLRSTKTTSFGSPYYLGGLKLTINGDSGLNYLSTLLTIYNNTVSGNIGNAQYFDLGGLPAGAAQAGDWALVDILISDYQSSSFAKAIRASNTGGWESTTGTARTHEAQGMWRQNAALSYLTLSLINSDTFEVGSTYSLYGVN